MTIRVVHIVNPTFGLVFSGHTHYLFSLLSGWKENDITFDLYGSKVKPLNLNSGDRLYHLPNNSLWTKPSRQNRIDRIFWSFHLAGILIARHREYDVLHFHTLNWGALLSPLLLHKLDKKIVYSMSLYGNDNPSYIRQQPRGKWIVNFLRRFDGFIALSPALVEDALNYGFRNVTCLPNFLALHDLEIDPTLEMRESARRKLDIPHKSKVLLFVGSIIHRKGIDILIDAFLKVAMNIRICG